MDFLVVPTATFRNLFVLILLYHHRRRVVHFAVTDSPTAEWAAQQIAEAFPWANAPRFLLRDRDSVYGASFRRRVDGMGIRQVVTAVHSPWQNAYVERVIGTIRRELLDHIIVLGESHLRRRLAAYLAYYHRTRTHLGLDKDAPASRPVEGPSLGRVQQAQEVGGLHHRYFRRAA
jgi:transposase InsO family protein